MFFPIPNMFFQVWYIFRLIWLNQHLNFAVNLWTNSKKKKKSFEKSSIHQQPVCICLKCVRLRINTRLEPHWNFILPHINMCSSERRHLKLYLFLIWWTKLDYKNKHTWSICIIPMAEIHLHWMMAMTKTNKWGLPPYSDPLLGICCVGNLNLSRFFWP